MSSRTAGSSADQTVGRFGGYGGRYVPESLIPVSQAAAEAIAAAVKLARTEGILPAIESAHALAWVIRAAGTTSLPNGSTVLVTLSGRGDKDVTALMAEVEL